MADGMTAAQAATLYERDFHAWTEAQAGALRAAAEGRRVPLDWLNLAEEIESLGRRDFRDVTSRLSTVIEHLLKLQFSPAVEPREGWEATVSRSRREMDLVLEDSPSLRPRAIAVLEREAERGMREAVRSLRTRGEGRAASSAEAHGGRYTYEQVTGDWWPDPA